MTLTELEQRQRAMTEKNRRIYQDKVGAQTYDGTSDRPRDRNSYEAGRWDAERAVDPVGAAQARMVARHRRTYRR